MADMPRETSGTAIGHELPFTGPVQSAANKGPYGGLGLALGGVPALAATPVRIHSSLAKRLHLSLRWNVARSVDANDRSLAQRSGNVAQEPLRRVESIDTVSIVGSGQGVDVQRVRIRR